MKLFARSFIPLLAFSLTAALSTGRAESLRVLSSPAVAQALASMESAMRDAGLDFKINPEVGSSASITAVLTDQAEVAIAVRGLTGADRASAPSKLAQDFQFAAQATAVIVARDVWESGVRALSKEQMRQIYESEVTNWKQLGGADQAIKFYNYAPKRGVHEQLILWVYGDSRRAPNVKFDTVLNGEDAQNTVSFNRGSITLAPPRWADGKSAFALAVKDDSGAPVEATGQNIAQGKYPMARPIFAIFADRPVGPRKRLLDFLLSPEGQAFLPKNDLTPMAELGPK